MGSLHEPSKRAVMLPDTVAPERMEEKERDRVEERTQKSTPREHIMSGITTAVVCHVTDDHRAAPRRFFGPNLAMDFRTRIECRT